MSQIGLAYGLSGVDLIECVKLARAHDYKRFWEQFGRHEIRPGFEHGGEVLLVVDEYLRERGVELPLNEAAPEFEFLAGEGGVVACASSAEAAATSEALAKLASKGADLRA